MLNKFDLLIETFNLEPQDLCTRYKIPIRTVYSWYQKKRKPADYVIDMIWKLEEVRHGQERYKLDNQ